MSTTTAPLSERRTTDPLRTDAAARSDLHPSVAALVGGELRKAVSTRSARTLLALAVIAPMGYTLLRVLLRGAALEPPTTNAAPSVQ